MKISNETKIGALTAVAVIFLILGFNFLKGRTLFRTGNFIYAKYSDTKKLLSSNPVYLNGYQIGSVYDIQAADSNLSNILVTIKLKGAYKIPDNSIAELNRPLLVRPRSLLRREAAQDIFKWRTR